MGVERLRALAKGDDLAGVAKALDQIDDAMDMTNVADDLGNVAKAVETAEEVKDVTKTVAKVKDGVGEIEGSALSSWSDLMSPEDAAKYNDWVKLREAGLD